MTTAEVKSVLGITDTTYDTDIAFFLPYVEKDIIEHCNNAFRDGYIYRKSSSALEFVRGDSDTYDYITDTDAEFKKHGFRDGMDIVVEGGYSNVGLYTISSASTGKLTLDEYEVLEDQDQDSTSDEHMIGEIRISRVKWPDALKLPAAKMVWWLIAEPKPGDAQSESLDDYSITYAGSHAYPTRVVRMLDKWRRPVFR
jgi:hypothetical protein